MANSLGWTVRRTTYRIDKAAGFTGAAEDEEIDRGRMEEPIQKRRIMKLSRKGLAKEVVKPEMLR